MSVLSSATLPAACMIDDLLEHLICLCTHFSGILNKQKTAEVLTKKGFKSDLWHRDWCSSVPLSKPLPGSRGGVWGRGSKLTPNTHMVWRSARPSHRTICVKYDHIIREQVSRDSCKTQRGNYLSLRGNIRKHSADVFLGGPRSGWCGVCEGERGSGLRNCFKILNTEFNKRSHY